jgi:hypothetical protein
VAAAGAISVDAPAVVDATSLNARRARVAALARHRAAPIAALIGIYAVSAVVYSVVAAKHILPDMFPDEMFYAKLSQALASGHGLSWRGSDHGIPPVWPILLSWVWHLGSVPQGYVIGKAFGAALASTAVVPVWLLAREFVGPRLALVPALLSVAGAWMCMTSYLASENLAYPLATIALACTVMALRRPGLRWIWAAVGVGAVAGVVRTQLLVLPVILVLALIIDVLRQSPGERVERFDARPRWVWVVLIGSVAAGLLAFVIKPDLTHYDLLAHHASVGKVAKTTGQYAISSVILFGVIPAVTALALMAQKSAWRNDRTGPVLATLLASIVVLFPVLGRFGAWATAGPVDRYNMYLAPVVMLAFVLAPGVLRRWAAVIVGSVATLALLLVPISPNYVVEQPALYGAEKRVHDIAPFFAHHIRLGLVLIALPIVVVTMLAVTSSGRRQTRGFVAACLVVVGFMIAQTWTTQNAVIGAIRAARTAAAAPQLDWVDRHVRGPAALLDLGQPHVIGGAFSPGNNEQNTDFFNRRLNDAYSTVEIGGGCRIALKPNGSLSPGSGACPPWPRYLVVEAHPFKPTLYGARTLVTTPFHGSLVELTRRSPRVLGLVKAPCDTGGCSGQATVGLFLDTPGRVEMTFSPAATAHFVQLGRKVRKLPSRKTTTVGFAVGRGSFTYHVPVSWTSPEGAPRLTSVTLVSGGQRTRLFGS